MNTCLRAGWAALPAALRWRFSQHHCPCQCEEAARRAARQRWFDKHRRGDPGCLGVPWSRCALLSLGQAMEPALARHQRGCSADSQQMPAAQHIFPCVPELAMGSLVLAWETDGCGACGLRCGCTATSSGASTGAGEGFIEAVNFKLPSPLRITLLLFVPQCSAQTQCDAECLACKW